MVLIIRMAATVLDNTVDVKCYLSHRPERLHEVPAAAASQSSGSISTPPATEIGLLISGAHAPVMALL